MVNTKKGFDYKTDLKCYIYLNRSWMVGFFFDCIGSVDKQKEGKYTYIRYIHMKDISQNACSLFSCFFMS